MVFIMAFNILERERVEHICDIPVISAGCATVFILSFNTLEREREIEILGLGLCHPTMVKQAIHQRVVFAPQLAAIPGAAIRIHSYRTIILVRDLTQYKIFPVWCLPSLSVSVCRGLMLMTCIATGYGNLWIGTVGQERWSLACPCAPGGGVVPPLSAESVAPSWPGSRSSDVGELLRFHSTTPWNVTLYVGECIANTPRQVGQRYPNNH